MAIDMQTNFTEPSELPLEFVEQIGYPPAN
jgi:hypothetical protein